MSENQLGAIIVGISAILGLAIGLYLARRLIYPGPIHKGRCLSCGRAVLFNLTLTYARHQDTTSPCPRPCPSMTSFLSAGDVSGS